MALAHPSLKQEACEAIACNYFVDAIDDPDFALKICERAPPTLDEALRVALQLEACSKEAVLIQYRSVTDRQTDRQTDDGIYHA